ncbi:MAG: hypothetical protein MUF12_09025 [Sediminibacterium sp.]|jgi:hypothetical protein|nr:hypothetical protein [Sediminibacterium sp.]
MAGNSYLKPVLIGSGLVGVSALAFWAMGKKKFAENVVINQQMRVEVVERKSYWGVQIPAKINLVAIAAVKNPTNTTATLTQPYVQIRLQENALEPYASSNISNKAFKIGPNSEIVFDPIIIPIDLIDLATKFFGIMKDAIKNKSLSLYTRTHTNLVTKTGKLPVVENDKTELKF